MTKKKKRDKTRSKQETRPDKGRRATAHPPDDQAQRFAWIPLWGWVLIFLVPLIMSEYMFYVVGRGMSMILFPVAWIGFWITLMHRAGWPILKRRKDG
ncbi:MAG: hypothetical protein SVX38_10820 [Chloroflexota bacterium]|nr:hypothetical protein [Chloroflexota bacterium]